MFGFLYSDDISELKGKTFKSVVNKDDEELVFETVGGEVYKFFHWQDCCENVIIEDVVGDLNDLIGSRLLMAEEVSSESEDKPLSDWDESWTWTYYKFATIKGSVDVRWYGASNGYYSESVDFRKVT